MSEDGPSAVYAAAMTRGEVNETKLLKRPRGRQRAPAAVARVRQRRDAPVPRAHRRKNYLNDPFDKAHDSRFAGVTGNAYARPDARLGEAYTAITQEILNLAVSLLLHCAWFVATKTALPSERSDSSPNLAKKWKR